MGGKDMHFKARWALLDEFCLSQDGKAEDRKVKTGGASLTVNVSRRTVCGSSEEIDP